MEVKERLTNDLINNLIYFANRQDKSISFEKATELAEAVMDKLDINNPSFEHKGTSWLARIIIDNYPFEFVLYSKEGLHGN